MPSGDCGCWRERTPRVTDARQLEFICSMVRHAKAHSDKGSTA
jgi:hypothetical protein